MDESDDNTWARKNCCNVTGNWQMRYFHQQGGLSYYWPLLSRLSRDVLLHMLRWRLGNVDLRWMHMVLHVMNHFLSVLNCSGFDKLGIEDGKANWRFISRTMWHNFFYRLFFSTKFRPDSQMHSMHRTIWIRMRLEIRFRPFTFQALNEIE